MAGVLDWEMATVGDPLMDLGGALAYWVAGRRRRVLPAVPPAALQRAGHVVTRGDRRYYCDRTGLGVTPEQWRFYEVFGLFRLAVIAQQIWYRYVHGQTHNQAYAVFGPAVGVPRAALPPAPR